MCGRCGKNGKRVKSADSGDNGDSSNNGGNGNNSGNGGNSKLINVAQTESEKTKSVKIEDNKSNFSGLKTQAKTTGDTDRWYTFSKQAKKMWKTVSKGISNYVARIDAIQATASIAQSIADASNITIYRHIKKNQQINASNVNNFNPLTLASIDENFRKATEPNLGYELSKVTYGHDNVEILEEDLNYDNLISQADDNVITFMINHAPKQYNLEYVDENKNPLTIKDLEGEQADLQQVKFGDDIKTMTPNDEKLGYDFKCWRVLDQDGNELTDGDGKPIDLETAKASWETLAKAADGDNKIKLKAVYSPKKYIIKYSTRSDESIPDDEFYIGKDEYSQLYQKIADRYILKAYSKGRTKNAVYNQNWKYGVNGLFNQNNKPTWEELIKSALLDEDGNNLIILDAVY